jgi:hypothetical protein
MGLGAIMAQQTKCLSAAMIISVLLVGCSANNYKVVGADAAGGGNGGLSVPGGGTVASGGSSPGGTGGSTGTGVTTTGGGNTTCHNFNAVTGKLKILAVVDVSGSAVYTDPNKGFRDQILTNFLTAYSAKTNFNWDLMTFAGTTASSLINSGSSQSPLFGTAAQMQTAIGQFEMIADYDNTPYQAALNLVTTAIQNDADFKANPALVNFSVVFMSDGMPTDMGSPVDTGALQAAIQGIVNISPNHITFSTIYYDLSTDPTEISADAIPMLQAMAVAGGGQFANTLAEGSSIGLGDVATIPGAICP